MDRRQYSDYKRLYLDIEFINEKEKEYDKKMDELYEKAALEHFNNDKTPKKCHYNWKCNKTIGICPCKT